METTELHYQISSVLVVFVFTLVVSFLIQNIIRKRRMPPGPWGFPIIGHLPLIGDSPFKTFKDMAGQYGDIFMIKMGSWPTVVLNSKESIREAYLTQQNNFVDRPEFFSFKTMQDHRSLAFGKFNKIHRKIANNVLRSFANVKSSTTEEIIQTEAISLSKVLVSSTNPHEDILLAVGSIMYQFFYGRDENCKLNEDFKMLVLHTKDFGEFAKAGNPVDIMPWLKYVMPGKVKKFLQLVNMVVSFRKRKVAEHLEMFQEHNLRDATDGFISAVKKGRKNGDLQELSDEQIYSSIEDIVGAGYDTMSTLIEWVIVCMTVFQNIQTKVQEEIDRVIGQRKPCVKDKGSLPYVEATILEIMRFSTISPLGLPHVAKKDTMLKNYFIPKGTVTFSNFYAVAHDARYWRTPENFDPRRFLTKNNEIDTDALGNVLTFGLGKRRCLGEFLAKAEIFIIFTTLLQQCTFQRVEGFTYNLSGGGGLTHEPSPYKVKVSRRY